MFFQLLKNFFFFDMLSLENITLDVEPNVSNKQEKISVNPYIGYDLVRNYI